MTKDVVGKGVQSYNSQSMGRENQYYVYIMASGKNGTLYVGMTKDLCKRVVQHKNDSGSDFVGKYDVRRLVYFEKCRSEEKATLRERKLKHWRREWKIKLVEEQNPEWRDLFGAVLKLG